ncbi:MAG: lipoprotein [Burkholderiaceae bacterium]
MRGPRILTTILAALALTLAACGQRGPLVLPAPDAPASTPAPAKTKNPAAPR